MRVVDDIVAAGVPYVMLCGGEPLVVPHFFAVAEALGSAGVQLKIETNGQRLDARVGERLARLPIRSIQVSLDGDTQEVYARQRPGGVARQGARRMPRDPRRAGCRWRSRSRPRAQPSRGEAVIERARSLGAFRFNTGRLMRVGTAARASGASSRRPRSSTASSAQCSRARRAFLNRVMQFATFPSVSRTDCALRWTNRRLRCWCCRTAGSRWRRRFPRSAPICGARRSSRPGERIVRPGERRRSARPCARAIEDESLHARGEYAGSCCR